MAKSKPQLTRTPSKYGFDAPFPLNEIEWELLGARGMKFLNGLTKYQHFKNLFRVLRPEFVLHDWALDQVDSLCRDDHAQIIGETVHKKVAWTGPAAAGKTTTAANFAFMWWLASPLDSFVILTSTTAKMVRKRIWPEIQSAYHGARKQLSLLSGMREDKIEIGHLVDSKTTIQARRGDDKHGIFAVAVEEGPVEKAMGHLQGLHAPRILIVVDEATDTSDAILRVCENFRKACQDFTILLIGNATPGLNPHTEYCEPENGFQSVSVEDSEWKTKVGGICLHFDGFKSPNVQKGRTHYPFIYTWEDYLMDCKKDQDTVDFWKYTRGYWAPEGVRDTIFTYPMVERCDVKGKFTFLSWSHTIAGLDPAFGGDKCVWRLGKMGDIAHGKIGIQLLRKEIIQAKATSVAEVDKQIAEQAVALNGMHEVKPQHFGMDATGTGRGVFSHIYYDWSNLIHRCEFGGSASDLPATSEDVRSSMQVYDRRVTELYFAVSEFVLGMQLKGLDKNDIAQFCARKFKDEKRKKKLETKQEFRTHYRQDGKNCSPDDADVIAVMIDLARNLGAVAGMSGKGATNSAKSWLALANESVYTEIQQPEFGQESISAEEQLFAPL